MLKQDAVPEPPLTVSQRRVTPDELTQALAAIEARRQAEAGTIPIDQAVSELHLDSTPDEIWAEVQAQRTKASAPPSTPSPTSQAEQEAADPSRNALFHRLQAQAQGHQNGRRTRRRHGLWGVFGVAMFGWLALHNGMPHHLAPFISITHPTAVAAPHLRPLSAVPDGTEVYADDAALIQISEGKPAAQVTVSANSTGNRWNLIKTGSHVYLRGYIESTDSFRPLQGKPLNVYNDDNSGELNGDSTSEITLRVDNTPLQKSGGDEGYSEVTVPNFQPDPLTTLSPWH